MNQPHGSPLPNDDEEDEARLRAHGYMLVHFWVPDVTTEAFKAEARRQALAIASSPHEKDDQNFVDAISDRDW